MGVGGERLGRADAQPAGRGAHGRRRDRKPLARTSGAEARTSGAEARTVGRWTLKDALEVDDGCGQAARSAIDLCFFCAGAGVRGSDY